MWLLKILLLLHFLHSSFLSFLFSSCISFYSLLRAHSYLGSALPLGKLHLKNWIILAISCKQLRSLSLTCSCAGETDILYLQRCLWAWWLCMLLVYRKSWCPQQCGWKAWEHFQGSSKWMQKEGFGEQGHDLRSHVGHQPNRCVLLTLSGLKTRAQGGSRYI